MNPTETFSIYFTFKDGSQDSLIFTNKEERDHVLYDLVEHLRLVGSMFIGGEDSFKKYFIARSSEIQTIVSVDPQPKKEEVDNED